MTKRLLVIFLALAPALPLSACGGGGGYGGDLYIDGSEIKQTPSLSNLNDGLKGDPDTQPYIANPLIGATTTD